MALNSAVTIDGGEIGRAQAVQAQAAGIAAHTDMNPVLLKPTTDTGAQVIIQGRVLSDMQAQDYHAYKRHARAAVLESYARLRANYPVIVVEGAGSPAEINLREHDIANMGFAEAIDCPVIIIADIDRGGVFAHLVGTLELLSPSERKRVAGFVINRFRGDLALLQPGLDWLQTRTDKPVLGVIPYLPGLHLEAEDALPVATTPVTDPALRIIVPALPRISNHTDFDPLRLHPQISLDFIGPDQNIPAADLIILPGSKNTRADLAWLRHQGWESAIQRHLRYGGKLLGICGGFQMLGEMIHDPNGVEDDPGNSVGLGLLPMTTCLETKKILRQVRGRLHLEQAEFSGYEIHMGRSEGTALDRPAVYIEGRADGAISADGQIMGSYVHGLFEAAPACAALLRWAGLSTADEERIDYIALREAELERLADTLEQHLDMDRLYHILGLAPSLFRKTQQSSSKTL